MAEHKKGLLSKAGSTVNKVRDLFGSPLPEGVPATEQDKENLRPGLADLAGGFIASRALPLLAAANPVGGALSLLAFGLLSGQAGKRQRLSERLVDQESARRTRKFEEGQNQVLAGQRFTEQSIKLQASLTELERGIVANREEAEKDRDFAGSQGTLTREAQERIAQIRTSGDKTLGIAQIISNINKSILEASKKFSFDPKGTDQAIKGFNILKSLFMKQLLQNMQGDDNVSGFSQEQLADMFGFASPSIQTVGAEEGVTDLLEVLSVNENGEYVVTRGGQ